MQVRKSAREKAETFDSEIQPNFGAHPLWLLLLQRGRPPKQMQNDHDRSKCDSTISFISLSVELFWPSYAASARIDSTSHIASMF